MKNYFSLFDSEMTVLILFEGTVKIITEFNELIAYYEDLREKKYKLFKQSGVYFSIRREPLREGPIEITDKFVYNSTGQI